MINKIIYSFLIAGGLLSSCTFDKVDDVKLNVKIDMETQEIYAGDEVRFHIDGNPDYIVFYSGEAGHIYANRERVKADIESMTLSYTIKQQYTETYYQNREVMGIWISEDFNGSYTPEDVKNATWTKLSGTGEGMLKVPTCPDVRQETVSEEVDFSAYKDKKFYLALSYQTPLVEGAEKGQPRVDVKPFKLDKIIDGGLSTMGRPSTDFGFNYVALNGNSSGNFRADESMLLYQPGKAFTKEFDIWAISQLIDPSSVSPDKGEPIKALDMGTDSYVYTYKTPGEYTATFEARNANMWNSDVTVKEIKVIVKERVQDNED